MLTKILFILFFLLNFMSTSIIASSPSLQEHDKEGSCGGGQEMVARIVRHEGFVLFMPLGTITSQQILPLQNLLSDGGKNQVTVMSRSQSGLDKDLTKSTALKD